MRFAAALDYTFQQLERGKLEPVDVAIVDSGIDATHKDLRRRVVSAWMARTASDGTVAVRRRTVPSANDAYGHGTGVAGIIAALAPNARLVDVRVLDEFNSATGDALVAGFRQAIDLKTRIINLSLACRATFAPQLHALCELAYRRNQLVIAAKRNMPLADKGFPAELSSCISVDLGSFPDPYAIQFRRHPPIEFVARGESVRTTARGGGYTEMTGTSFATPTVAGLCALLVGAFPKLRPFEVKTLLKAFAERRAMPAGR